MGYLGHASMVVCKLQPVMTAKTRISNGKVDKTHRMETEQVHVISV